MDKFRVFADDSGGLGVPPISNDVDNLYIAPSVNKNYTVPAGTKFVLITSDGPLWMKRNGAAAVPAADITNGSGYVLLATGSQRPMFVEGVATLQFMGTYGARVSIERWI